MKGSSTMTTDLQGTTALVTGATSGIGRATAVALAKQRSHVAVAGRNRQRGDQVVNEITAAGGRAVFVAADLTDAASARRLAVEATEQLGQVDIVAVFDLNVRVPFFLVAELGPAMAARGHGAIINLSTMVAEYGNVGTSLYGASKAAVVSMTKTWAAEYGPHGVRVNAVSPGPTSTEGTAGMTDALGQLAAPAPAGRPASADEIAEAIVFLASQRASYIHGAILPVDGGRAAI